MTTTEPGGETMRAIERRLQKLEGPDDRLLLHEDWISHFARWDKPPSEWTQADRDAEADFRRKQALPVNAPRMAALSARVRDDPA